MNPVPAIYRREYFKQLESSFRGSDLDFANQITIFHDLEIKLVACVLYKNGSYFDYKDFQFDTLSVTGEMTFTINSPYVGGDIFHYRLY